VNEQIEAGMRRHGVEPLDLKKLEA
jgi:hypothetical protein